MSKLLLLHLIGAGASLIYLVAAVIQALTQKGNAKTSGMVAIGLASYQTATGALMLILVPGTSVLPTCLRGAGYLFAMATAQVFVSYRLKALNPARESVTVKGGR
jgi:hypothetical protein